MCGQLPVANLGAVHGVKRFGQRRCPAQSESDINLIDELEAIAELPLPIFTAVVYHPICVAELGLQRTLNHGYEPGPVLAD